MAEVRRGEGAKGMKSAGVAKARQDVKELKPRARVRVSACVYVFKPSGERLVTEFEICAGNG